MPSLRPHPSTPSGPVETIEAEAGWSGPGRLGLRYELRGDLSGLKLAPEGDRVRTDGLWPTTCFEAFLQARGGQAYVELNLAPSGAWAAYAFDDYREGMRPEASISLASFARTQTKRGLIIVADFTMATCDAALGLSAVVESSDGAMAYWALVHPAGRPDFHHPDCFAGRLTSSHRP